MNFAINLIQDTEEVSRQFQFCGKAFHPQMESIVALRDDVHVDGVGSEETVLSIAACGFTQLALMGGVPDAIADKVQTKKYAFISQCVVNVNSKILTGITRDPDSRKMADKTAHDLQVFLGYYAGTVYSISDPIEVRLNVTPCHETTYDGVRWLTYSFAYAVGVEKEEWDKMYENKAHEVLWATAEKLREEGQAAEIAKQALHKMKGAQ